jgi:hypothetical protein
MSFLAKIAALEASGFREMLGLPAKEQLAAPAAFELALQAVSIMRQPSWALPKVVEVLAAALGVSLDAGSTATAAAVAAAPAAPEPAAPAPAAPARAASSKRAASTSADFAPAPKASKQATLFQTNGITKYWLPKPQLAAASRAQAEGEAVPFGDFVAQEP